MLVITNVLVRGEIQLGEFNQLPKSLKKTVRYILQDTDLSKLQEVELVLLKTIKKRKEILKKEYVKGKMES